ncbi:uncharacterized protein LOC131929829 [Physella acuta]|uniref:uncharacterized protein LOC131929829 n=1 Tax=Physella acuta TaxID=109671 RepID=UPI0027DBBC87|nr:uncharacterized protein LOC131929829 [Physella acuta]
MNALISSVVVLCAFLPSVVPAPTGSEATTTLKPGSCDAYLLEKCVGLEREMKKEVADQECKDEPKMIECFKKVKKLCEKDTVGVENLNIALAKLDEMTKTCIDLNKAEKEEAESKNKSATTTKSPKG